MPQSYSTINEKGSFLNMIRETLPTLITFSSAKDQSRDSDPSSQRPSTGLSILRDKLLEENHKIVQIKPVVAAYLAGEARLLSVISEMSAQGP